MVVRVDMERHGTPAQEEPGVAQCWGADGGHRGVSQTVAGADYADVWATHRHTRALDADRAALAAILIDLGQYAQAERVLIEVLASQERNAAAAPSDIAVTLHNLGSLRLRQGAVTAAVSVLRRARTLKETALGPDHPDLAITLYNLALCYRRLGQSAMATGQLVRAIEILAPLVDVRHPTLASCRTQLASMRRCEAVADRPAG
jgi:tetratricopeptide (TPR) repeat protein